jgi:hypothetical protein
MISLPNFIKDLPIGLDADREDRHTNRIVISLAFIFPLGWQIGQKIYSSTLRENDSISGWIS